MRHFTTSLTILSLFGFSAYAASRPAAVTIDLGTAANFGVLGGSGVTNTSSGTLITGNVGSSPTPTVTGLIATQVLGTLYLNSDPVTAQAQVDLAVAYNEAATAPCGKDLTGQDLGGMTLIPGVYCFSSSALLTGTLTLDGQGDADAQWIFQIGTALTAETGSGVSLINGAAKCNIYWQIGSSETVLSGDTFVGNILALTSITLDGGTLNGRALARNGAVTIAGTETIDNSGCNNCTMFITNPTAGTVSKLVFPIPYRAAGASQTVIATGLTSAAGLTCGLDQNLYISRNGTYGGLVQIVGIDQSGHLKNTIDFRSYPSLASSGGPAGVGFQPVSGELFFSTTQSHKFSNTGVWGRANNSMVQAMQPFTPNGASNGGGAIVFLTVGPYAGNMLALDVANNKVIRVTPPFTVAQSGTDFITTNLITPTGLAVLKTGNIFVSNLDGTIQQFGADGSYLGQYANTGLHNMNLAVRGSSLFVATTEGPVVWVHPDGSQSFVGTVGGANGIAICAKY